MSQPASAIVVPLSVPPAIERLRRAHDRSADLGVPPHVTILFPFVDASALTAGIREQVAAIAGEFRAFDVTFATAARWPGVVYLEPDPSSRFSALIDRCVAAFPEHPPYGGAIDEVIPHLTVVESNDAPLEQLSDEARAALPFTARAIALDVLVEGDNHRWRRRWRLPFRP